MTGVAAAVTAAAVFVIFFFLVLSAWPAIVYNGSAFFTSLIWNPGNEYGGGSLTARHGVQGQPGASFGILSFVIGTLATSGLAMLIATPIAVLVAIAMVYRVPPRFKIIISTLVELMAGVPSVVYGLWGIVVFVPLVGGMFGPFVTQYLAWVPFLGGRSGSGYGLFSAGAILAIMVLPIMAATMRDIISTVPRATYEGSIALGATSWETVTKAIIPSVAAGLVGSMVLALGRALGETMAVLMVSGGALNQLPTNLFSPVNTMAAVIVSQLDSALTDASGLSVFSLAEVALALFVITLVVNLIARGIVRATAGSKVAF